MGIEGRVAAAARNDALYLRDPDQNGVELYYDRPKEEWPRPDDGDGVAMYSQPVDLEALLAEVPTLKE